MASDYIKEVVILERLQQHLDNTQPTEESPRKRAALIDASNALEAAIRALSRL